MVTILFIGDIIGDPGLNLIVDILPQIQRDYDLDFVIANGENVRHGKGITIDQVNSLKDAGVDVITSGNHIWEGSECKTILETMPFVLRPHNYPHSNPGSGIITIDAKENLKISVINLQGRSFLPAINCPFETIDNLLSATANKDRICVVDFHAESTAEKQALAWYLDGRVSAVIGTHTHVQTADERILPNGTGYITDAGMTGPFDTVIGMNKEKAIKRFRQQIPIFYKVGKQNMRFNGVLLEINTNDYKTRKIKRLNFAQME